MPVILCRAVFHCVTEVDVTICDRRVSEPFNYDCVHTLMIYLLIDW
jgi:hypothetical protein